MSSGISIDDSCVVAFNELKLSRKYRYIVYRLNDDLTKVIIEKKVESCSNYDEFVEQLPEHECRWAVYDFEFQKSPAEGQRNKLFFIAWAPETAKIKQKMVYASTKEAFKKKLVGCALEVQGTDFSEISYEAVLEKARQF